MSDDVLAVLEQQPDLSKIRKIGSGDHVSVYKAVVRSEQGKKKQIVRVIRDIKNYHVIKREKDLLTYLNQFPEVARFNEIRKVGFYYLQFFDYIGTRNLAQHVKKKGTLSSKSTKSLLATMVSTLKRAHRVSFVHGAVSPENIIMGKKRTLLVDWSQAIPVLSSFDTETIAGDLRYTAPERLNGQLDEKSDIYMLGCTLYFALTGKHIYFLKKSDESTKQLWAHAHHSIRKLNRLPIFWRYLIIWMTQKEPEKRPNLKELKIWIKDETVPDWVRKSSIRIEKSFPEQPLTVLADEHYLYPTFKQALRYETTGDLENAFNLYESCAFRGYSRAENNLGLMYENGRPIRKSYAMAANMYEQAYRKGNPFAAYNLARLFEQGLGMPVNLEQAMTLYEFSALKGHLKAQNALARMYQNGAGTPQDLEQARYWFRLAAHYGHEPSQQALKTLNEAP
ncbi:MAG: Sel1-like repeat-containing protein kinase family protein [Thiomicrorhabdus sp.]|nr:Sel1-like repeat-containing protein kinase family protein [Thiomicrorhabdus sp.]